MTRAGAAGARFRQRKLSTKQSLQVLREDQVDKVDDEAAQRNVPKVETGVEKGEEIEHHLQAAISASQAAAVGGKVAQIFIPTPDTIQSNIQYDRFYPLRYSQPSTYIRFSSTVEDCIGCTYCMNKEDEVFLLNLNQKRKSTTSAQPQKPCTDLQFESVMEFFEETAKLKQPFAAVDNPPVVSYDEMEASFDETVDENSRVYAKEIYEHWSAQRLKAGNRPLMPALKFETGQETDDADPYVCFRRREVRQVRKTRGRDAQSTEKLRKLRKELEDARQLILSVKQREKTRRELIGVERTLFEQRAKVKEAKRKLGIKGDDEDLINQKPQKKKSMDATPRALGTGPQLRIPPRPNDLRATEMDLVSLKDTLVEKENELAREIEQKIAQHRVWNNGYVDLTRMPLTPLPESAPSSNSNAHFRTAVTEYLPTPPTSASSDAEGEDVSDHTQSHAHAHSRGRADHHSSSSVVTVRYASPPPSFSLPPSLNAQARNLSPKSIHSPPPPSSQHYPSPTPSFRRRIGRGGRLMIDRRNMYPPLHLSSHSHSHPSFHHPLSPPSEADSDELNPLHVDRFMFDHDSDGDEAPSHPPVYLIDQFDALSMRYRAGIYNGARAGAVRPVGVMAQAGGNGKGKGKGGKGIKADVSVATASAQKAIQGVMAGQAPGAVQRQAAQVGT